MMPKITPERLSRMVDEANFALDQLRQLDNAILFDLHNPPELAATRGLILDHMRKMHETISLAEQALRRLEDERKKQS